jgi:hypothetical protein
VPTRKEIAEARAKKLAAQRGGTLTAAEAAKPAIGRDLDDPDVQFSIENPERMTFRLEMPDGHDRTIAVRTKFSYADVNDRRIMEDLQSFQQIVLSEAAKIASGLASGAPPATDPRVAAMRSGEALKHALRRPMCRELARSILLKLAEYVEPWDQTILDTEGKPLKDAKGDDLTVRRSQPSLDELVLGMSDDVTIAASLFLLNRMREAATEYEERRKNLRAAAALG